MISEMSTLEDTLPQEEEEKLPTFNDNFYRFFIIVQFAALLLGFILLSWYNSSIPNWLEWTLIAEFPLGFLLLIKRFPLIVRVIITAPTLLTALFLALNYCFSGDTTTVYEATFENTQIEYHRSGLHRSKKYLARYASENGFTIERPLSKHDYDHDIYPPENPV